MVIVGSRDMVEKGPKSLPSVVQMLEFKTGT